MKQKLLSLATGLLLFIGLLFPVSAAAAGASITLDGNKSTVASGGSLVVAIYMNGGGNNVDTVQSDINFPSSKLQYVGFSASGSAFEIAASNGGSDGFASIARGTLSPVNGSALVGTITFKALASSGSASITVASSSVLASAGNSIGYGIGNTTVNFGAVAAAPTSTKAAAAPAAPEPPKDTTAPTITAIKAKTVTPFSATIGWTTNEAADSAVEYGVDTNYGLSASVSTPGTDHAVPLGSAFLTPQTVVHYRVKSTDGSGNATVSPDQTLTLPGVPVTVYVRGANGKPQAGVSVTLDNQTKTTNTAGAATFATGTGNKQIVTSVDGVTIKKDITVSKTEKPLPPYQLSLAKQPEDRWMMTSIVLASLLLLLLGVDAFLFGSRYFDRLLRKHPFFKKVPTVAPVSGTVPAASEPVPAAPATVADITPAPVAVHEPHVVIAPPRDLGLVSKPTPTAAPDWTTSELLTAPPAPAVRTIMVEELAPLPEVAPTPPVTPAKKITRKPSAKTAKPKATKKAP